MRPEEIGGCGLTSVGSEPVRALKPQAAAAPRHGL